MDGGEGRRPSASEQLRAEIERIEGELDGLYAAVIDRADPGTGSPPGPAGGARLSDLVERARTLKATLQEKRSGLSKLERAASREHLLLQASKRREVSPRNERQPRPTQQRAADASARAAPRRQRDEHARPPEEALTPGQVFRSADGVLPELAASLDHQDADLRRDAVRRLGDGGTSEALELLTRALDDPSENVKRAAMNGLIRNSSKVPRDTFKRLLSNDNPHIRLGALRAIARATEGDPVPHLLAALEDEEASLRTEAATLLALRRAEAGVLPLVLALRDIDDGMRATAAAALGSIGDERAVLGLLRALLDESLQVRGAALDALAVLLGETVEVDIQGEPENRARQVAGLVEWWRLARVDEYFDRARDRTSAPTDPDGGPQGPGGDGEARASSGRRGVAARAPGSIAPVGPRLASVAAGATPARRPVDVETATAPEAPALAKVELLFGHAVRPAEPEPPSRPVPVTARERAAPEPAPAPEVVLDTPDSQGAVAGETVAASGVAAEDGPRSQSPVEVAFEPTAAAIIVSAPPPREPLPEVVETIEVAPSIDLSVAMPGGPPETSASPPMAAEASIAPMGADILAPANPEAPAAKGTGLDDLLDGGLDLVIGDDAADQGESGDAFEDAGMDSLLDPTLLGGVVEPDKS